MSSSTGRTARRRRVLNEGALASSADATANQAIAGEAGQVRRYAPAEDSVSFAIVRRLMPQSKRVLFGLATIGLLVTGGLLAAHHYQAAIVSFMGIDALPAIDLSNTTSLARWIQATLLLALASICVVLFGVRQHRSDDVRGVYRWWLAAAMSAVALSACLTTNLHQSLAVAIGSKIGWSPLAGDAFWWAMPMALVFGAVLVRMLLDVKENPLALTGTLLAGGCGVVTIVAQSGGLPDSLAAQQPMVAQGSLLVALGALTFGLLAYARGIVREADGLAPAKPLQVFKPRSKPSDEDAAPTPKETKAKEAKQTTKSEPSKPSLRVASKTSAEPELIKPKRKNRQEPEPVAETAWTDGSDGGIGSQGNDWDYEDDGPGRSRKLTKAERKRLRKQKENQHRAA